MRYMMFIESNESFRNKGIPQALNDAMGKFVTESFKSGALVDTAGLQPSSSGSRIKLSGGKLTITDGPFTEAKEVIGGYAIVEAKDKKEAMDIATRFMELHRVHWPEFEGTSEIRPIETYEAPA